jgi:hypothetical protein
LNLQIKSYEETKDLKKVWAWRACARANQQELTTCAKQYGQQEKGKF